MWAIVHGIAESDRAVTTHWWLSGEESACQCRRHGFDPCIRKIPWKRRWQPTPVFLPGKSRGQRSLMGYSPWSCKRVLVTNKQNTLFNLHYSPYHVSILQMRKLRHGELVTPLVTELLSSRFRNPMQVVWWQGVVLLATCIRCHAASQCQNVYCMCLFTSPIPINVLLYFSAKPFIKKNQELICLDY